MENNSPLSEPSNNGMENPSKPELKDGFDDLVLISYIFNDNFKFRK